VVEGAENPEFTIGQSFNTDSDITLSTRDRVLSRVELKLTLSASSNAAVTPVLDAITLRALPQPKPQKVMQFPLQCYDSEEDRNNVKIGTPGSAWQRLAELEDKEASKSLVTIRDTRTKETFRAWITNVEFINTTPPQGGKTNFGGILRVTVTRM
jgi:hypothetical protein